MPAHWAAALVICAVIPAIGQQCPQTSATGAPIASEPRTLEGRLIYHDGIQWFELRLDRPVCGEASIRVLPKGDDSTAIQVLRGCRVRSTGALDIGITDYLLGTYQRVTEIEPVGACVRKPPFPDYSKAMPDKTIDTYRVDMHVDYRHGSPIVFRVSGPRGELKPWQAYASYWLTGGRILYGNCGKGFVVDKVFGTPQARPSHFDAGGPVDMAMFNPEGAATAGKWDLHLGYTCVRKQ